MTLAPVTYRAFRPLCSHSFGISRLAAALVALGCSPSGAATGEPEQQGGASQQQGGASGGRLDAGSGGSGSSSAAGTSSPGGSAQSGGQTAGGGSGASGGSPSDNTGGKAAERVCSSDPECNDNLFVSSLWGQCLPDGSCSCSAGRVLNPRSGRCAVSKGSDLNSSDGWAVVGEVSVAARGDEGAVVYVEENESQARVLVQRFDANGTFFGNALELATAPLRSFATPAIASDGQKYLVCWAGAGEINCHALDDAMEPTPAFHAEGKAVAIVRGSHSWLIGYAPNAVVGQPAEFVLRRLGDDFEPQSATASFTVAAQSSSYDPIPLLASTDSEFVLVATDPAQADRAQLYRLDAELNRLGAPLDLGQPFWFSGCVSANATLVAVSLAKPYASNLILADAAGVIQSLEIRGGGKTGMHEALLANDSELVASWFTSELGLHSQVFSNGTESPELPPGTSSDLALVRVSDRVLGVYRARPSGPADAEWSRVEGIAVRPLSPE